MALTVDELRVAAEAAERWPQGTDDRVWGFRPDGTPTQYIREVAPGKG